MPTPPPFDFYADNPSAPIQSVPVDQPLPPLVEAAAQAAEALRRHMEGLAVEAGADPARLALRAIILLADRSQAAYQTEPHFHAVVEYARRGVEAPAVDWRAMFGRYSEIVADREGVDFLDRRDWPADEWAAIEGLAEASPPPPSRPSPSSPLEARIPPRAGRRVETSPTPEPPPPPT